MDNQLSDDELQETINAGEPFLGLASTKQLIEELKARGEIATVNGETWANTASNHGPLSTLDETQKLINELYYRAHVSEQAGEKWPAYRTVDGGFSIDIEGMEE